MIETILMVWFSGWVLWMLGLFMLGSLKGDFAGMTLVYAVLPFVVVLAFIYFVFIFPFAIISSKNLRDKVIESRKRHISGYSKEEV
jgi:uncharacterized membrane protein